MAIERPPRFPAFRIVVILVILVNLILTIALVTQVSDLQQRFTSLPPDLASKRDVAMLRPLRVREILMQNCVECHSSRRLGVTVSMEPAEIQRTVERMQTHPGADIPPGEFERITFPPGGTLRALPWRGDAQLDGAQDPAGAPCHHPSHGSAPRFGRAAGSGARHCASV